MMQFLRASSSRVGLTPRGKVSPGAATWHEMRALRTILFWLLLAGAPALGWTAQAATLAEEQSQAQPPGAQEENKLPQAAVEIAHPFGFPITNSMVVTWVVAVGLIIFAQLATH